MKKDLSILTGSSAKVSPRDTFSNRWVDLLEQMEKTGHGKNESCPFERVRDGMLRCRGRGGGMSLVADYRSLYSVAGWMEASFESSSAIMK